MARLYLNPAARLPNEINISGSSLVPELGAAVIDPTAAFQQDFYEQAIGTKVSDGSRVAAYTTTFNQLAAMLEAGPGWMLMPQAVTDPLINQGIFTGYPNGELKNGAALSATELATGVKSVALDGINDYVETGWTTRTNMLAQPSPEVANTQWSGGGGFFNNAATLTRDTATTQFDGVACWKVVCAGSLATEGVATGGGLNPLTSGKKYTASVYAKGAVGGEEVRIAIGSSEGGFGQSGVTKLSATEWTRISITFTATGTKAGALAITGPAGTKAQTFYFDAAQVEEAESPSAYFPTVAHLTSGEAGWSGTAYESPADIGPFSRGTVRTFVGIAKRTSSTTEDALIGTSGSSSQPSLQLASGSQNVDWNVTSSGQVTWAAAWPGNNVTAFYALIFNDGANTASLYINGALVSTQAQATTFTAPGTLRLGHRNAGTAPFEGSELPFAVYPRGLSGAEILAIYSGP